MNNTIKKKYGNTTRAERDDAIDALKETIVYDPPKIITLNMSNKVAHGLSVTPPGGGGGIPGP